METLEALAVQITPAQWRIIQDMEGAAENDTPYKSFAHIAAETGINARQVAGAVRDLRALGVTQYARGLMTDDGAPYGSGYALTPLGLALRAHLLAQKDHTPS